MSKTEIEIERKFLLKKLPHHDFLNEGRKIWIDQLYYLEDGKPYRIRKEMEGTRFKYTLVHKEELEPGVYNETTSDITEDDYNGRLKSCHSIVTKVRHRIMMPTGLFLEIDYYRNINLVVLEVELPSRGYDVELPDYIEDLLIMEVTEHPQFKNINLALPNE